MNTILVGLDASSRAPRVLDAAIDLAQQTGAMLHLYRAVGLPNELPAIALSATPAETAELLQRLAKQSLEKVAAQVPAERLGGTHVSLAIPWQGICQAAAQVGANLVVIGSHGYGGIDRLLGTTAAKVVNHSAVSVLVVK